MLTENHITDLLEQYFIYQKYGIIQKLTTKQKGFDLIVNDGHNKIIYVEVKLMSLPENQNIKFALGLPKNRGHAQKD